MLDLSHPRHIAPQTYRNIDLSHPRPMLARQTPQYPDLRSEAVTEVLVGIDWTFSGLRKDFAEQTVLAVFNRAVDCWLVEINTLSYEERAQIFFGLAKRETLLKRIPDQDEPAIRQQSPGGILCNNSLQNSPER